MSGNRRSMKKSQQNREESQTAGSRKSEIHDEGTGLIGSEKAYASDADTSTIRDRNGNCSSAETSSGQLRMSQISQNASSALKQLPDAQRQVLQNLESFHVALSYFSSGEHQIVHIGRGSDNRSLPSFYECSCGEKFLKDIQFIRHLLYYLGTIDLHDLKHFANTKIDFLKLMKSGPRPSSKRATDERPSSPLITMPPEQAGVVESKSSAVNLEMVTFDQQCDEDPVANENSSIPVEQARGKKRQSNRTKKPPIKLLETVSTDEDVNETTSTTTIDGEGETEDEEGDDDDDWDQAKQSQKPKPKPKRYFWKMKGGHGIKRKIPSGPLKGRVECFCGAHFARLSATYRHVLAKWEPRQYRCQHPGCDKVYNYKHNLTMHAQIHATGAVTQGEQKPRKKKSSTAAKVTPAKSAPVKAVAATPSSNSIPVSSAVGKSTSFVRRGRPPLKAKTALRKQDKEMLHTKYVSDAFLKVTEMKTRLGPKVYKCDRPGCDKVYETKKGLTTHVMVFHDKIYSKCLKCQMIFKYKSYLYQHLKLNQCLANKGKHEEKKE